MILNPYINHLFKLHLKQLFMVSCGVVISWEMLQNWRELAFQWKTCGAKKHHNQTERISFYRGACHSKKKTPACNCKQANWHLNPAKWRLLLYTMQQNSCLNSVFKPRIGSYAFLWFLVSCLLVVYVFDPLIIFPARRQLKQQTNTKEKCDGILCQTPFHMTPFYSKWLKPSKQGSSWKCFGPYWA